MNHMLKCPEITQMCYTVILEGSSWKLSAGFHPSGGSGGESVLLPFPASEGPPHSLAHGPILHFTASILVFFHPRSLTRTVCLPLIRTLVVTGGPTWLIQEVSSSPDPYPSHICKIPLPHKVTYPQVPRMKGRYLSTMMIGRPSSHLNHRETADIA